MIQERLHDAAIALHLVLSRECISFGIFGGYAVTTLCGVRESKDVDCLASVSKALVIQLLCNEEGFQVIPQSREDYVAFFWSDRPDRRNAVLVEIFCEQFPGAQFSMEKVGCNTVVVTGGSLGEGITRFLEPFYLFKGKLRACATRTKFYDSVDLRALVGSFESLIKPRIDELNPEYVGLAMKRYPELEILFERLGMDIGNAKRAAAHIDHTCIPRSAWGGIQKGLLE